MAGGPHRGMPVVDSWNAHTEEWNKWLEQNDRFYYQCGDSGFSCRKEGRHLRKYWYAYKQIDGKLHKKYLGIIPSATHLEKICSLFEKMK